MTSYYAIYGVLLLLHLINPISAQIQQQSWPTQENNAYEIVKQIPEISKFASMLNTSFYQYLTANIKNNITILAPNNDAISELTLDSNSTWYHLIPRFCPLTECDMVETKLNGAFVKIINRTIESGLMHQSRVLKSIQIQTVIVHILDKILTVPVDAQTTLFKLGYAKARDMVAQAHEILHNRNQATLFIPNNKAFGTVDPLDLGKDVNKLLFDAHVTKGVSISQTWKNNTKLATHLPNNSLTLTQNDGYWYVSALEAENQVWPRILVQDILLENGVMHIIDQVLWANNWARMTKPATTNVGESQYKLIRPINILTVVLFVTIICV